MPLITRDYHRQIISTMKDLSRYNKWWSSPINLGGGGGTDGGSGVPIGGIHGQLIQSKVAYDTTEAAYSGIINSPPSGSLVDNLAHIRNTANELESRVTVTESGLAALDVRVTTTESGLLVAQGDITVLDERVDAIVASGIPTSGFVVQEDDVEIATGITILNFEGAVTVIDEGEVGGFGKATVISNIDGSGIAGAISGVMDHGALLGLTDDDHPYVYDAADIIKVHDSGGITVSAAAHVDPGAGVFEFGSYTVNVDEIYASTTVDTVDLVVSNEANFDGTIEHSNVGNIPAEFLEGILTRFRDNNVSDPPTQAELVTAFGAVYDQGFVGVLDDAGNGTDVYLITSNDADYFYIKLTKGGV